MTELVIIKAGNNYYRFKDGSYFPCDMNKASVFPLERLEEAKELCSTLHQAGIAEASLKKLFIIEEPYLEG
jgi:hypothetical protein